MNKFYFAIPAAFLSACASQPTNHVNHATTIEVANALEPRLTELVDVDPLSDHDKTPQFARSILTCVQNIQLELQGLSSATLTQNLTQTSCSLDEYHRAIAAEAIACKQPWTENAYLERCVPAIHRRQRVEKTFKAHLKDTDALCPTYHVRKP